MSDQEVLWIITDEQLDIPSPSGDRAVFSDLGGMLTYDETYDETKPVSDTRRGVPVPVKKLKQEMDHLLQQLGKVFSEIDEKNPFQLDEVEVSVEINGEGQISLFGMGVKTGSKGSITLKLKRKNFGENG